MNPAAATDELLVGNQAYAGFVTHTLPAGVYAGSEPTRHTVATPELTREACSSRSRNTMNTRITNQDNHNPHRSTSSPTSPSGHRDGPKNRSLVQLHTTSFILNIPKPASVAHGWVRSPGSPPEHLPGVAHRIVGDSMGQLRYPLADSKHPTRFLTSLACPAHSSCHHCMQSPSPTTKPAGPLKESWVAALLRDRLKLHHVPSTLTTLLSNENNALWLRLHVRRALWPWATKRGG